MNLTQRDGALYQALAARLAAAIRGGSLRAGDRMPSVRMLSRQHRVSIATAMQAYRHLENQRLVEARPKSGFFAAALPPQPAEPAQSRPPAAAHYIVPRSLLHEYLEAVSAPGSIRLGAVLPQAEMFPAVRLARLTAAVARQSPALMTAYDFSKGAQPLRQLIAGRSVEAGCRLVADEVIVTDGCLEALHLSLRAVARAGDTIALESPTYFGMLRIIESLGMKALEMATHPRTGLSIDALDWATRKRNAVKAVMLTANFSNPLGSLMPDEHKKRLVDLCESRGIAIIENDVYGDVAFDAARPMPLKAWDRSGNVLLCSSFSKTLAPGLRVGWVAAGKFHKEVEVMKLITTMFTAHVPQLVIAEFIARGGYDHHLRKLRAALSDQSTKVFSAVAEYFPRGTRVTQPSGGYSLWIEFDRSVDSVALFRRARNDGIVIAPGPLFTNSDRFANCIRVSQCLPWSSPIERAFARLGQLVAAHASH